MNKKVLITGGAGYIGSYLSTLLVNNGFNVTVLDKLEYSKTSLNHLISRSNFLFINGDVKNKKNLKELIDTNDIVIPLAALVGAPLCAKKPKEAKILNYEIIKFICDNLHGKKIIFPTTNSGYGTGTKNKYCDENTPLNPISLYGVTKKMAEDEVAKTKNFVSFRLATVFGYSFRMRTDLLINNFVSKALKYKKILLYEPHFKRNYIHISDVADAFLFAINNFNNLKGEVYNLGLSSANLSKLQLANLIKKHYPITIKINNFKKDPDQRNYIVSNKKIEKKGFKAKFSISNGIKELIFCLKNTNISSIKNNY
jgi:nucleoside-diphosphate-sugar epimerase